MTYLKITLALAAGALTASLASAQRTEALDARADAIVQTDMGGTPRASVAPRLPSFNREKGTTQHTADDIQKPGSSQGSVDPRLPAFNREKGTTQHTADDVQSPASTQAGVNPRLPAFKREKGTTQHTADDVQAPRR